MSLEEEWEDYNRRKMREHLDNDKLQRKQQKTEQTNSLLDRMFIIRESSNKKQNRMDQMEDEFGLF